MTPIFTKINTAVADMDKVTQQNAANAEEAASAAEEMNAQADQMKQIVNELVVMVGESKSKTKSTERPVETQHAGTGRQKQLNTGKSQSSGKGGSKQLNTGKSQSSGKGGSKQLNTGKSQSSGKSGSKAISHKNEVTPNDVIPMDDSEDDFSNF